VNLEHLGLDVSPTKSAPAAAIYEEEQKIEIEKAYMRLRQFVSKPQKLKDVEV
jgi:hypothetical protein